MEYSLGVQNFHHVGTRGPFLSYGYRAGDWRWSYQMRFSYEKCAAMGEALNDCV